AGALVAREQRLHRRERGGRVGEREAALLEGRGERLPGGIVDAEGAGAALGGGREVAREEADAGRAREGLEERLVDLGGPGGRDRPREAAAVGLADHDREEQERGAEPGAVGGAALEEGP